MASNVTGNVTTGRCTRFLDNEEESDELTNYMADF